MHANADFLRNYGGLPLTLQGENSVGKVNLNNYRETQKIRKRQGESIAL
jgi:hypothetical protein